MTGAKQAQVLQIVAAAVGPEDDVMSIAPGGRPLAAGPLAVAVPGGPWPPPRAAAGPLRSAPPAPPRDPAQGSGDGRLANPTRPPRPSGWEAEPRPGPRGAR